MISDDKIRFGLIMFGPHRIGQFELDDSDFSSSFYKLKNVYLQSGLVDMNTNVVNNMHCIYVETLGETKLKLVKDLGHGNLIAHGIWLGVTQTIFSSASFIVQTPNKYTN